MKNLSIDIDVDFSLWEEVQDKFWQRGFLSGYRIDNDWFKYLMEDKDWEWKVRPWELSKPPPNIGFVKKDKKEKANKVKIKLTNKWAHNENS